tara:strand:+ start:4201 stop:4341 length:141 start_codon:yes stop_codon:yes gene_type:complete
LRRIPFNKINSLKDVDATTIRERMAKGEEWKHLVPEGVEDYIEKIK